MNAPLHGNTRTLVLTGASRGIGHATVKKFGASGWRIITVSRQPFSALCPWPGGDKNHVQIDLADSADVGRGIDEPAPALGAPIEVANGFGTLGHPQACSAASRNHSFAISRRNTSAPTASTM